MSISFSNGDSFAGSDYAPFFKAASFESAYAIIFEPKSARDFEGKWGSSRLVDFVATVFLTRDELVNKTPSVGRKDFTQSGGNLGRALEASIGNITVGKLGKVQSKGKPQPAWVIQPIPDEDVPLVQAFLEERAASDANDLPDFLRS